MTVIVYEHPLSPYAQKVKIALDEKGVAYQTRMPAAIGSGQPDQEFLKANPRGEVPALIDGDWVLTEAPAILRFYAATLPQLGWTRESDSRFRREHEVLKLESAGDARMLTVRFTISPE